MQGALVTFAREMLRFYEVVQGSVKLRGWGFSRIRVLDEGLRINYMDVVNSHLGRSKTLLDIGTRGGERLGVFAPKVKEAI